MNTPNKRQDSANKQLERIDSLVREKRFNEAFASLKGISTEFCEQVSSKEAAYYHYLEGYILWELGDKKLAVNAARKALDMYLSLREFAGIAKAENLIGSLLIDLGNLTSAQEHLQQAIAGFKFAGDFPSAARALNQLAYLHYTKGEFSLATHFNKEARECADKANDHYYAIVLGGSLAAYQVFYGQWKLAMANLGPYLRETKKAKDFYNIVSGLVLSGVSKKLGGNSKSARADYIEAVRLAGQENLIGNLKIAYEYLAELSIAEGRFAEAEDYLKKALEIGERVSPYGTIMTQCWRLMGDLYNAKGEPSEALKAYETCESYLIKLPEELERGACFVGRGVAYANLKNWKDAKSAFDRAFEVFENCENDWELFKAVVTAVECGAYASKQMGTELLMGCEFFQKYEHPAWEERARKLLGGLEGAHDRLPLDAKKGNLEKQEIITALQETGNNVTLAAKKLGLLRSTLHYKIKRYKI
ncbi:MAG TPA: tetratricopeptide repeat protein, partial [Verrucomicrobiae bacterium]|nr:tetratricopeptide repeat protein [Verrucomicrobiae bacterium]